MKNLGRHTIDLTQSISNRFISMFYLLRNLLHCYDPSLRRSQCVSDSEHIHPYLKLTMD